MASDAKEVAADKPVPRCGRSLGSAVGATDTDSTDGPLTFRTSVKWVVNLLVLECLVTSEGFAFKQVSDRLSKKEVIAMSKKDKRTVFYQRAECEFVQKMKQLNPEMAPTLLGFLHNANCRPNFCVLRIGMKKLVVSKWLTENNACVVCYEQFDDALIKLQITSCPNCQSTVCFGCFVDMFSAAEAHGYHCPVCREEATDWSFFLRTLMILDKGRKSLEGMTDSQLDFIAELLDIDLREDWLTAEECIELVDLPRYKWHELSASEQFANVQAYMRRRRKKAVASASSGGAVAKRTSDGCANCGKSFWDKRERKRAPKCLKCKRTAYCCAKCRKRHWKTHASHCAAMKPKGKRKPKRKPKKGGCAPF